MRRVALAALVAASALLVAVAPGGGGSAPARRTLELQTIAAQPANRAAVIVDKGDGSAPKQVCIRFDASSITGEEALRLAAAQDPSIDPVFSEFSGMGKAVCALCGVGCPSGDCFCDPKRYWAYSRADAGSTTFQASPVGVSSSEVTHGDVEGYRWGSGAAPAFTDIETICGEVPAEATTTTTTADPQPPSPAPSAPLAPPLSPSTGAPPPVAGPPPGPPTHAAPGTTTTPADDVVRPTTTSTTAAPDDEEVEVDDAAGEEGGAASDGGDGGDEAASVRLAQDGETGGGGSGLAVAGVGATFLALVGGSVALRRARRLG